MIILDLEVYILKIPNTETLQNVIARQRANQNYSNVFGTNFGKVPVFGGVGELLNKFLVPKFTEDF